MISIISPSILIFSIQNTKNVCAWKWKRADWKIVIASNIHITQIGGEIFSLKYHSQNNKASCSWSWLVVMTKGNDDKERDVTTKWFSVREGNRPRSISWTHRFLPLCQYFHSKMALFCNDRVTNLSLFCKDGVTKYSFQTCGRYQGDLRKLNFDKYVSSRLQAARGRRLFATNGGKWKARNKVSWQLADLANDLGNSSRSELRFCSKYKYNNSYVQIRNLVSANRNSSLKMGSGKNAKKGMFYFLEKLEGGPLLIWLWLLVFCQPAFWVK